MFFKIRAIHNANALFTALNQTKAYWFSILGYRHRIKGVYKTPTPPNIGHSSQPILILSIHN